MAPGKTEVLLASKEMEPIAGTVEVDIPVEKLWKCFQRADLWPHWNACFRSVRNRDLIRGEKLVWVFNPIRWWYLYVMPASANIVESEPNHKVTWEVTVLPGFFARHTYHMEDLGNGRSRFGSWEQAMGWSFRLFRRFWLAHFTFVKDRSLEGARRLERIYRETGRLDPRNLEAWPRLKEGPRAARPLLLLLLVLLLAGGGVGLWFYLSFVRLTTAALAPGITAVFSGGSNSLVVESGGDMLVVDPKFPPGSRWLRDWLAERHARVTRLVNTHYHYDHTQGNVHYLGARIFARPQVREFMRDADPDYWPPGRLGLPTDSVLGPLRLTVGSEEIVLVPTEPAHTHGDLMVLLPRRNIVATGDIVFHTYYPFLDTDPRRGASIPGMVRVIRDLVRRYPGAVFLPGHGPLANASNLSRYADYLDALWSAVEQARREGSGPRGAARRIDFGSYRLSFLPSFHNTLIPKWATARRNLEDAYRLAGEADRTAAAGRSGR